MRESVNGRHTGGAWSNGLTGRRFVFAAITVFPRMVKRKKAWYNDSGDSDSRQAVEPARRGEAVKEKTVCSLLLQNHMEGVCFGGNKI